ncbi:MAG: protein DA1 [Deltaproteobacteria bacterium]
MSAYPICKSCTKPINGPHIKAMGADWHPEHFRCASCGQPVNQSAFKEYQGLPWHIECFQRQTAMYCAYCNKALVGQYQMDGWGTKFCPVHSSQYPVCLFCGRLVPSHQQEHVLKNIGYVRCPVCRASAIETQEQAQPFFPRLAQWVNSQGLRYNNLPLKFEVVDTTRLSEIKGQINNINALGATLVQKTVSTFGTKVTVSGVAILQGLPSTLFHSVTVHELGHAWIAVHGITGLEKWAEEGFCQLLAHRLLVQIATLESKYHTIAIERNNDPVYGEGFRRVRAVAESVGFLHMVNFLLTSKRLPNIKTN